MTAKNQKPFLFAGIAISVISACLGLETQHANHLGWALLLAGTAFSAIGAIHLGIQFLKGSCGRQAPDYSFWLPAFGVLIISLVTPLEYLYLPPILTRSDHVQDIGLILFAGGMCFYLLLLRTSRSEYPSQADTQITLAAVLRWICNPAFASLTLFALGLSIGYSSLIGLFLVIFLVLPALVLLMKKEDRAIYLLE